MRAYSSGRPRVHACIPEAEAKAAIAEYEAFAGDAELAAELLEVAADLREELSLRQAERA